MSSLGECLLDDESVILDPVTGICKCNPATCYSGTDELHCTKLKQCGEGEELGETDTDCVPCRQGYFKNVTGCQKCNSWQSCNEGKKITVDGNARRDRQCSNVVSSEIVSTSPQPEKITESSITGVYVNPEATNVNTESTPNRTLKPGDSSITPVSEGSDGVLILSTVLPACLVMGLVILFILRKRRCLRCKFKKRRKLHQAGNENLLGQRMQNGPENQEMDNRPIPKIAQPVRQQPTPEVGQSVGHKPIQEISQSLGDQHIPETGFNTACRGENSGRHYSVGVSIYQPEPCLSKERPKRLISNGGVVTLYSQQTPMTATNFTTEINVEAEQTKPQPKSESFLDFSSLFED